jgi:hypothetical protein
MKLHPKGTEMIKWVRNNSLAAVLIVCTLVASFTAVQITTGQNANDLQKLKEEFKVYCERDARETNLRDTERALLKLSLEYLKTGQEEMKRQVKEQNMKLDKILERIPRNN